MMATLVRYHRKAIKLDDLPRFTLFKKKQFLSLQIGFHTLQFAGTAFELIFQRVRNTGFLRYLLEQAAHVDDCNFVSRLSRSCQC